MRGREAYDVASVYKVLMVWGERFLFRLSLPLTVTLTSTFPRVKFLLHDAVKGADVKVVASGSCCFAEKPLPPLVSLPAPLLKALKLYPAVMVLEHGSQSQSPQVASWMSLCCDLSSVLASRGWTKVCSHKQKGWREFRRE